MGIIEGILTILSVIVVKKAYEDGYYVDVLALLWAILLGWNLHTLISMV
jgi:hypothetical protein